MADIRVEGPCRSEGEQIIQDFIREQFSNDFTVWMNLELCATTAENGVSQMEIDIVIFHQQLGLLLGEIKDWRSDQLQVVTKKSVHLTSGRRYANPATLLRQKYYAIRQKLGARRELCDDTRRLGMPINVFCCFPFIVEEEWGAIFRRMAIQDEDVGLPRSTVLLGDEIVPGGALTGERRIQRLDQLRSMRFPVTLGEDPVYRLDKVLRGYAKAPTPEIAVLKDSGFRESLQAMRDRGGPSQLGAEKLYTILKNPTSMATELLQLQSVEALQIANCLVYTINTVLRLVAIHHDGIIYLMFVGDRAETETWIAGNKGATLVIDKESSRIRLARVTDATEEPSVARDPVPALASAPLLDRLPDIPWAELGLRRLEVKFLKGVTEDTDPTAIDEVLGEIDDKRLARCLGDILTHIRRGQIAEANAAYDLYTGRAVAANTSPAVEDEAIRNDINSDVICLMGDLALEEVQRLLAPSAFEEWMLFLHPEQRKIVEAHFDRPAVLKGVSGSGKTVVLIHRARRLAQLYPNEQIGILTLNRSLAVLLKNLLNKLCVEGEQERIEVFAFYDYFKKILSHLGAEQYLQNIIDALHSQHEMLPALEQALQRHRNIANDFEPRSGETLDDTWEDYWRSELQKEDNMARRKKAVEDAIRGEFDVEAYLRDEFSLIRSAFPWRQRSDMRGESYYSYDRRGRSIPFNEGVRQNVLRMLLRYEEYMFAGQMLDELGLAQALYPSINRLQELPGSLRKRCILVDEFQDFSTLELRLISQLPTARENGLFMTGDTIQKVLVKDFNLAAACLDRNYVTARTIRKNYRNSRQILHAASILARKYGDEAARSDVSFEVLDPELAERETAMPIALKSNHAIEAAWKVAMEWLSDKGCARWNVCLASANPALVPLRQIVDKAPDGVLAAILTGDYGERKHTVSVGYLADVKGFEFSLIVVVGCSRDVLPSPGLPTGERWRDALRLYVAMTRGRDQVVLTYEDEPSEFLLAMTTALRWDECTVSEKVLKRPPLPKSHNEPVRIVISKGLPLAQPGAPFKLPIETKSALHRYFTENVYRIPRGMKPEAAREHRNHAFDRWYVPEQLNGLRVSGLFPEGEMRRDLVEQMDQELRRFGFRLNMDK
jgi:superfamily I DNA/RNA helicase